MERPSYLRALRILTGLTQWDLSQRIGTGQCVISALESGKRAPRPDEIVALATAFEISAGKLAAALKPTKPDDADEAGR